MALAMTLAACGGGAGGTRTSGGGGGSGARGLSDELPPAPAGSLWADGFGPTLREASLDARRAVSEQLDAKIASRLDARETEDSLRGGSRDVSQRIRTESAFEHAELIEIGGEEKRADGYVVRAYLRRERAANVYREEIAAEGEKLAAVLPVAEDALGKADAARLLRVDRGPGHFITRLTDKGRVLTRLDARGGALETAVPETALALERRLSAARRGAVLRLAVTGDAPPAVRAAVIEAVGQRFAARGCALTEAPHTPPEPGATPIADVTLALAVRESREAGVDWRYLGLEIEARDARTGESFFRFSAMPDLAKGGGKGLDKADRGLVKHLGERLPVVSEKTFDTLTCR
jgi:hypothetical protein